MMHVVDDGVAVAELDRLAEEFRHVMAGEKFLERIAGEDRARGQNAERHQHGVAGFHAPLRSDGGRAARRGRS